MNFNSKIFVAGHRGMVGSAILRRLKKDGYNNIIVIDKSSVDLRNQLQTLKFFEKEKPEFIFLAAARVGGILENFNKKAEFIRDNLQIQTNIIDSAHQNQVKKLLFLGSSCIYPRDAKQPLKEDYLLTGPLEETNDAYAIAKIAGLKMCEFYTSSFGLETVSLMPTNLYGPNDNFDLITSHVFAALIRKFTDAQKYNKKTIELWGDGSSYREFLHVDDLADACLYFMKIKNQLGLINIGTGQDITIKELADKISTIIGYGGKIHWDKSKPNGTPRKLLNIEKAHSLGWKHNISLNDGIKNTYRWYLENK